MTGAEFSGVDIDLLADYIGGALTGTPEESAVAARIAGNPDWQAAYTSLTEGMALVSAELGRFIPEPMPADLAARLDAALTIPPTELGPTAQPTFLDLIAAGADPQSAPAGTTHEFHPTATGTAHEIAATNTSLEPTGASTPQKLSGAGTSGEVGEQVGAIADPAPIGADLAQPDVPHLALVWDKDTERDVANPVREKATGRRLRWAAPIAVAAGVVAFVGFGLDYLAGRSGPSQSDTSASSAGAGSAEKRADAPLIGRSPIGTGRLLASGTDYTRATLGVAPVEPMTAPYASSGGSTPARQAPGPAADSGSPLQRLIAPTALDDCLKAIEQENGGGTLSVESVDFARFAGAPAVIVRFTANNGHWAWASGADCGTLPGDAATLDKVPVG